MFSEEFNRAVAPFEGLYKMPGYMTCGKCNTKYVKDVFQDECPHDLIPPNEMQITEKYPKITELYCYKCGVRGLRCEEGEGDYHAGIEYYCPACKEHYTMGT